MSMIAHPSPNHGPRPEGATVDMVILHYTGMPTGSEALARLCDPQAQVSAHYLVEEDGRVFALVPEDRRAWHAGVSFWAGDKDINSRSIGIEIVNPGHEWGYRDFPEQQIGAVEALLTGIASRHTIPLTHYLGHSDVAPARKEDPGERFPWERLAKCGFGVWPRDQGPFDPLESKAAVTDYQQALRMVGYDIELNGALDEHTRLVTVAFQRHFQPARIGSIHQGHPDGDTLVKALWLAQIIEKMRTTKEG